jgi:hypothetical protein
MKRLNCAKIRVMFVGFVAAIVFGGGNARADFTFGQRVNLGPVVNSPYGDYDPFISADGLLLYFDSERPGGFGKADIWVTMRATVSDPWGPPANLGTPVNSEYNEAWLSITADGLILAFSSDRPGGLGGYDIWLTTRTTKDSPWGPPTNLGSPVNSTGAEFCGSISPDGCSLYFSNALSLSNDVFYGGDIYVTTRPTRESHWGPPVNLGLLPSRNGSGNWHPSISSDGSALFFCSDYIDVSLFPDIWLATWTSKDNSWGTPILLGPEINTSDGEEKPSISDDGSTLYWCSGPSDYNKWDLWQSTISPIVDLNSDGIVDSADLCIIVDHWGEDYSLCDIGPMPWGDGVVDVEDLKVLAEHMFEEVFPIELIGYWKLDEVEGDIAYNSVSDNHGVLSGNPTWQPDSGQVAGALQFDGVDDYISTDFVLNPSDNPFSIFAWIKDGAAGQAILSQENGANWLIADSIDGVLKTDLKEPASSGRDPQPPGPPLICSKVITDGDWHRVGFVRDGINRILYVDDVEVARDTAANLEAASGGLYIGAGSGLEPGTFWSGLIDDVRLYKRVVSP